MPHFVEASHHRPDTQTCDAPTRHATTTQHPTHEDSAEDGFVLELPLGGIRCWEQTVLRLVEAKAHPKVTLKTTAPLVRALASYGDWTTGADIRPGWKRLAAEVGCSRRSVAYHLKWLQEMGVLELVEPGTRLSGGIRMAAVYKARIPNLAPARRAQEDAVQAHRVAERARTPRRIGARHVTCSAAAARSKQRRATNRPAVARRVTRSGPALHDRHGFCTPPGVDLSSENLRNHLGFPVATDKNAATKQAARDLARWLKDTVVQFRDVPVGLAGALLYPLVVAGWTRDDLAYWLGLKPLPAWYIKHTTGQRVFDPWPLPAAGKVERAFGLLAHRCAGLAWQGFELPSAVHRRAFAASVAHVKELMTADDRRLAEESAAELAQRRGQAAAGEPEPAAAAGASPSESARPRIGSVSWDTTLASTSHKRNLDRQAKLLARYGAHSE